MEECNKQNTDLLVYLENLGSIEVPEAMNIPDDELGEMPVVSKQEYLSSFNTEESSKALKQFTENFKPVDTQSELDLDSTLIGDIDYIEV